MKSNRMKSNRIASIIIESNRELSESFRAYTLVLFVSQLTFISGILAGSEIYYRSMLARP